MAVGINECVGLDEGRCMFVISTQTYTLIVVGIKGCLGSSIKKYHSSIVLACLRCLSPYINIL